jgi:hypothetical protein
MLKNRELKSLDMTQAFRQNQRQQLQQQKKLQHQQLEFLGYPGQLAEALRHSMPQTQPKCRRHSLR